MNPSNQPGLVLAIHPASKGFGWALYENDRGPVAWGLASARDHHNERSMKRFTHLVEQYRPSAIVLEAFDGPDTRRGDRIQTLAKAMCGSAKSRDIDTYVYHRPEIGKAMLNDPAATRHQVAEAAAARLPFLEAQLPEKRHPWNSEDARQPLFDAVALLFTHLAARAR